MNMQLKYPPARRRRRSRRRGKTRSARIRERERKKERGNEALPSSGANGQATNRCCLFYLFRCFSAFPRGVLREGSPGSVPRQRGKKIRAQAFGISRAAGIVSLTRAAAVAAAVKRERGGGTGSVFPRECWAVKVVFETRREDGTGCFSRGGVERARCCSIHLVRARREETFKLLREGK